MSIFGRSGDCGCGEPDCYICQQRIAEDNARRSAYLVAMYGPTDPAGTVLHYYRPQYRNGRMLRECLTCSADIEDKIHVRDYNWDVRRQTLIDQVLQLTPDDIKWLREMDAIFKVK